jgi:DNA-binding SARP family transcriptional activator
MTLEVHLLGVPRVIRDGEPMPAPRGHKVWGLLAYLLLRDVPATRAHLAEALFPDAQDPLAALRWALSVLRRLVGAPTTFRGDPVLCGWPEPPEVDVLALRSTDPTLPGTLDGLGPDLLEGMAFGACPSFEIWLEAQRRHARGAVEGLLHEGALARLAHGDAEGSADLAARLVAVNPYDTDFQALLVRSLAAGGHGLLAAHQAASCRELFRRELGVDPGPALDAALMTSTASAVGPGVTGRAAVLAQIEAGDAAIRAGAVAAGLECLRRAVTDARSLPGSALTARALTSLGAALVHAARGSDEEGATALHQALACADADPVTVAQAYGELAYVEFLRGRYGRAEAWLARADVGSAGAEERVACLVVRGAALSDTGRYRPALVALRQAVELSRDERRRAYALSMIGRAHLLRGELGPAVEALDESLDRARRAGWTTFLPWPESFRAEVDLIGGDLDAAQARLDHAFALGCQIGDPCWEAVAARGLGLLRAAEGDTVGAAGLLVDAGRRGARLPDAYVWVQGYVLDALATLGVAHGLPEAPQWVGRLAAIADRCGMAELAVRAAVHRWRLGDPGGLSAARVLADGVDNPALDALLAR